MATAEKCGTNLDLMRELVKKCTWTMEKNPSNVIVKVVGEWLGIDDIEFDDLKRLQQNLSNYVRKCKSVAKKSGKSMSKIIKNEPDWCAKTCDVIDLIKHHISSKNIEVNQSSASRVSSSSSLKSYNEISDRTKRRRANKLIEEYNTEELLDAAKLSARKK